MTDEIRPESDSDVLDTVAHEAGADTADEAASDDEPDVEAHGPVGIGPRTMGPLADSPEEG